MQTVTDFASALPAHLHDAETPREVAWRHYQALALGGAEAARLLSEDLVAILLGQRSDDFSTFTQRVEALGLAHQHLVAAASGLKAVREALGVA